MGILAYNIIMYLNYLKHILLKNKDLAMMRAWRNKRLILKFMFALYTMKTLLVATMNFLLDALKIIVYTCEEFFFFKMGYGVKYHDNYGFQRKLFVLGKINMFN